MINFFIHFNVFEGIITVRNELATIDLFYRGLIFAIATMIIGSGLLLLFKSFARIGKSLQEKFQNSFNELL